MPKPSNFFSDYWQTCVENEAKAKKKAMKRGDYSDYLYHDFMQKGCRRIRDQAKRVR